MLPSILEIVRNAIPAELLTPAKGSVDSKGSTHNEGNLWDGIDFEDEDEEWESETNESQEPVQEVDDGPPGEGAGQWVTPRPTPPLFDRPQPEILHPGLWDDLSGDEKILIRRGASLRMIEELDLEWTEDRGVTASLGEYHYHFGWRIARDWRSVPAADLEMAIQLAMINNPERFYFDDGGCIIERTWVSN